MNRIRLVCLLVLGVALNAEAVELIPKQSVDNVFDHGVLFSADQVDLGDPESIAAAGQLLAQRLREGPAPITQIPKDSWIGVPIANLGATQGYWRLDTEMASWFYTSRGFLVKDGVAELVFDAPGFALGIDPEADVALGQEVVASDVLVLEPGEAAVLWLQYAIPSSSWERVRLLSLEDFSTNRVWDGQKFGLIFGAFAVLTLFFLVFSMVLRSRPALYYGLFFLGMSVLGFVLEGLAPMRVDFTPGSAYVTFNMIARLGSAVAYIQFMRSFLQTNIHQPRFDKVIQAYCWATPIVILWNILAYSAVSEAVIVLGILLFSIFQVVGGVIAYRSKISGTGWYLVGTMLVLVMMVITILTQVDVLEWSTRFSNDIAYLLILADGLIFGGAIVTQAFALRRERDGALRGEMAATQERLAATESMLAAVQERDSAVQLADMRRQRLAAASHDLRQPLLSLERSIGQLDGDDQATDQLREQLNTGLRYLNSVVGDNLEEARPEDLSVPAPADDALEPVSVDMLFANLERMFSADAQAKGLALRFRHSALEVQGQPIDLIRMLVNLTANAIKFTQHGGVLVAARKRGESADIEVWDTGPGLAASEIHRLLQAYQTGEVEGSGEGLGLAIVQDLARAGGYQFQVNSRLGRGSLFAIRGVPLA